MRTRRPWALLFGILSLLPALPRLAAAQETEYQMHAIVFRLKANDRFDARIGDKHLFGSKFYEQVGRPDLAAEYDRRDRIGNGMIVWALVGSALSFPAIQRGYVPRASLHSAWEKSVGAGGWALLGSSVGLGVAGYLYKRDPISRDAAHALSDDYNESLRRRLGISAGVMPLPDGAGVSVGGQF